MDPCRRGSSCSTIPHKPANFSFRGKCNPRVPECHDEADDSSGYDDPRAKTLEAGAKDWRLLLQMDSDDDLDVMWGDAGILYFWIQADEARRGDFSNAWMILQCG